MRPHATSFLGATSMSGYPGGIYPLERYGVSAKADTAWKERPRFSPTCFFLHAPWPHWHNAPRGPNGGLIAASPATQRPPIAERQVP